MRKLLVILLVLGLQGCGQGGVEEQDGMGKEVGVVRVEGSDGEVSFDVEVADEESERRQGLMFRESLAEGKGMWFVFEKEQQLAFWMKNVKFPIDIIFVDKDLRVLNVAGAVPGCEVESCENYYSQGQAKYVLEVNAGVAEEAGIERGDLVSLDF